MSKRACARQSVTDRDGFLSKGDVYAAKWQAPHENTAATQKRGKPSRSRSSSEGPRFQANPQQPAGEAALEQCSAVAPPDSFAGSQQKLREVAAELAKADQQLLLWAAEEVEQTAALVVRRLACPAVPANSSQNSVLNLGTHLSPDKVDKLQVMLQQEGCAEGAAEFAQHFDALMEDCWVEAHPSDAALRSKVKDVVSMVYFQRLKDRKTCLLACWVCEHYDSLKTSFV